MDLNRFHTTSCVLVKKQIVLALVFLALPLSALAEDYMRTGSYTGDSSNSLSITGLGFQPDLVIVKTGTSKMAIAKTTDMGADLSKKLGDDKALETDRIISLDADGFTVGGNDEVNKQDQEFYWVAMKSSEGTLAVGQYVGNGSSNRQIPVSGLSPDAVMVLPGNNNFPVYRHQDMNLYEAYRLDGGGLVDNSILYVAYESFNVGYRHSTNEVGADYYYVAWSARSQAIEYGYYYGDNSDDRTISGLNMTPEYLFICNDNIIPPVHRPASLAGDATLYFNEWDTRNNLIQSLSPGEFQVGADNSVNAWSVRYMWMAFANPPASADIQLDLAVSQPNPLEGESLDITLTATNLGPENATGIEITNTLPTGLTFVSATPSHGTYEIGTGLWDIGAQDNGEVRTLVVTVSVDAGTAGTTLNAAATVTSGHQDDPDSANNSDSQDIFVTAAAGSDLQLGLEVDDVLTDETDTVTYTLKVINNGPADATGILIQDNWPATLGFDSATPSQGAYNSGTGLWDLGSLTVGTTETLQLVGVVLNGTAGQIIAHGAVVSSFDQTDPNNTNDSVSVDITVQTVDVQVSQVVNQGTPEENSNVDFTVIITNLGPGVASGLEITDNLPAGMTFVSSIASQGSYNDITGLWTLGDLSAGTTHTLGLRASTDPGTGGSTITNTSTLSGIDQTDSNGANNSGVATIIVAEPSAVDLSLTQSLDNSSPNPGETVTFTITVENPGPSAVTGLEITDLLPPEVVFVSAMSNKGNYLEGSGVWTVGDLDIGYQAVLNLLVSVTGAAVGAPVINSVNITAVDQDDPDSSNNTATTQILVPNSDLQMSMTRDLLVPVVGDTVTYFVKVFNDGPNQGSGIIVTDALPQGLSLVSSNTDLGSFDDTTGQWTVGSLNPGLDVNLELQATVETVAAGTELINNAWVSAADQTDPQVLNNNASSSCTIVGSDLELALVADQMSALEGDEIGLTLTVTNNGPDDATGVSISQVVPSGLSFVSATPSQGSFDDASGLWTLGALTNSNSATLVLAVTTDAGTTGETLNNPVLVVTSDPADPDPTNNQATVGITVVGVIPADENLLLPLVGTGLAVYPGSESLQTVLKFQLVNRGAEDDTLNSLTLTNLTEGTGTDAEMDGEWQTLQLFPGEYSGDGLHPADFSNGTALFENLEWPLAAGDTLVVTALAGASLNARDSAHLRLGVQASTDLDLTQAYTLMGVWPLVSGHHLTVEGFVAAQATVHPLESSLLPIGSQDNLALVFDLPGNGYLDDTLYSITLENFGTALPLTDISALKIWSDNGDGLYDPESDTNLGQAIYLGDHWQLMGLGTVVPTTGHRFYATVDIAETAQPSRDIRLGLPQGNGNSVEMFSGNDGPVDHALESPTTLGISVTDRVILTSEWFLSTVALPGSSDTPLLQFLLTNTYASERELESLTFTNTSVSGAADQSQLDALCQQVHLRLDANGNGELDDPSVDRLLASGIFVNNKVIFNGLGQELPADSGTRFFVTADLGLTTIPDGTQISGEIESLFDVNISESTVVANWPVQSGSSWTVNGMIAEQIVNHDISVLTLGPGEGPILALDFTVPANGFAPDELIGLVLTNEGSATSDDLQEAKLWSDGGNGIFEGDSGDDVLLGNFTVSGTQWSSTVLAHNIPAEGSRLFASLKVAATPSDSVTVKLGVPQGGVTVSSGNDGPLDEAIPGASSLVISTSPLRSRLVFPLSVSDTGQSGTIVMTVRNAGSEVVTGIEPDLGFVLGESLMEYGDPTPLTIASLIPGGEAQFTWTFNSIAPGEVVLEGNADGLVNGDQVRRSIITPTSNHRIFTPVPNLELYPTANLPFSINRGQQDLVPLTLTFINPGDENVADAQLTALRIRLMEGPEGPDIVPADLLEQVVVSEGTDVYLALDDLPTSGGVIDLVLAQPVVITGDEPVTLGLRLDLKLNSTVPSFLLSIEDGNWLTGNDAVNSENVVTLAGEGSFPVRTGMATLVAPAAGLNLAISDLQEVVTVPGQEEVLVAEITLSQSMVNDSSSSIDVGRLAFRFHSANGAPLDNPLAVFSHLSLQSAFQEHYAGVPVVENDSLIVMPLSAPVTISGESSLVLRLLANIQEDAPLGPITPLLADPDEFDARDGNMNNPVPVNWATDPDGASFNIVGPAGHLQVGGVGTMPLQVSKGTRDLDALTLELRHPGSVATAPITCDTLVLEFMNPTRQPQNPAPFLDRIRILQGSTVLGFAIDPNAVDGRIVLPLIPVQLDPDQSVALSVNLDFRLDSIQGGLEVVCHGTGIRASDLYSSLSVEVEPAPGTSLPLSSGTTQIVEIADELTVGSRSLMPALLAPQVEGSPVMSITVTNPANIGSGGIQINTLTLAKDFNKADTTPLGEFLESVVLRHEDTILATADELDPEAAAVVLEPDPALIVNAGQSLEMVVEIHLRSGAPSGALKLVLEETGIGAGPPGGEGVAIRILPASGQTFPMFTESGNVGSASLEASYANFPNPFAAGREPTTFAFSLAMDATVNLRIMTPHGELVATLLENEPRGPGLHQSDLWQGFNGNGTAVHNGVYLAELVVKYSDGASERLLRKVAVVR
jgi:uncharacterized repeat protein (TIGR01451 family)